MEIFQKNTDCYVAKFQSAIEEGPFYMCVVCQRLLYRCSVSVLNLEKYQLKELVTDMPSFDAKKYICKTCHQKLLKNKMPCQAVCNKLEVYGIPEELSCLNKLETISLHSRSHFRKFL